MTLLGAIAFAATFFIFCCLGAWRIFEYYLARLEKKIDEIIDKLNQVYSKQDTDESDKIAAAYQLGRSDEKKQKEPKPNIELIQRSWYMEGYHDREFGKEPKWIVKTGEGGPHHELNPRYGKKLAEEQNPAWSEEDENMLNRIIETLSLPPIYDTKACAKMVSWLKSLRPSWKPSKEEMEALDVACSGKLWYGDIYLEGLKRIREQLKKL